MAKYAMHVRGLTTNLTVNEALAHIFLLNETQRTKLTDERIAQWMVDEFAGVAIKIDAVEVLRRRRQYNASVGAFKGKTPAVESKQYDAAGNVIPDHGAIIRNVAKQTGLTVEQVKDIISEYLAEQPDTGVTEQRVRDIIAQELVNRPTITINVPEKSSVTLPAGTTHKCFQECLDIIAAGLPLFLVGPAGSGKSYLAAQLAKALGREFSFNSMSAGISESALLGRTLPDSDGSWTYKPSPFVTAWTNGGVHLLDEMDAADPNLLVQVNAALANGMLSVPFADAKPFKQHSDTVVIGAANTFGTGADRMYVGRNQLDAATMNRFTFGTVEVDYDRELEKGIALSILNDEVKAHALLSWAWGVRDQINSNKLRRLMSTRNIEHAALRMRAGASLDKVKATYMSGWTEDEKRRIGA